MPHSSQPTAGDHTNNTKWKVHVMNLLLICTYINAHDEHNFLKLN